MTVMTRKLQDRVKESIANDEVWVYCNVGVLPIEWANGKRAVSDEDMHVLPSGKIVTGQRVLYRDIDTRSEVGADAMGFMRLDPKNDKHPVESDAAFLERIKDWLENSGDPRIAQHRVYLQQGATYSLPDPDWNELQPSTLMEIVALRLGDDPEANEAKLIAMMGYELNRPEHFGGPRQQVIDELNDLAEMSGVESVDTDVADDSLEVATDPVDLPSAPHFGPGL